MKIKKLIFCIIILINLIIPNINAYDSGTYGAGEYGKGVFGTGETIIPITPLPPSSSSSGSSGGGCTNNWECTDWFPDECPASGIQERICINRGTCTGTDSMPETTHNCTYKHEEPLFDIFLKLPEESKELCSGEKIKASIQLENFGKIEFLDAFMTYWIVDENNSLIAEVKDTRAVTNEKDFEIEIKIPNSVTKGKYKIYAQINYNENSTAVAGETFQILPFNKCNSIFKEKTNLIYPLTGLGIIITLIILLLIMDKLLEKIKKKTNHKKYKEKIKNKLEKIKYGKQLLIAIAITLIGILASKEFNITGFAIVETIEIVNIGRIFALLFISSSIGLMAMFYKRKLKRKLKRINKKEIPKNYLSSLIDKKTYTEGGEYIGKVEDIHIKENKIDYLRIKLDKKKFDFKGIIIKYKEVESVGDIIIIKESLVEILKNKNI